jgi:Methyltransferase domain
MLAAHVAKRRSPVSVRQYLSRLLSRPCVGVRNPVSDATAVSSSRWRGVVAGQTTERALSLGDARRTGLPSSSFEVVHDWTLLANIPDPAAVVVEMTRLARPGGWLAGMEPDLPGLLCHPPLPAWDRLAEISVAAVHVPHSSRRPPGALWPARHAGPMRPH